MYFVGVDVGIDPCHSERSETEPKNLRIIHLAQRTFGAKILRLPPVAQDDRSSSGSRYSATFSKGEGLGTDSSTSLRMTCFFGVRRGMLFAGRCGHRPLRVLMGCGGTIE